MELIKAIAMLCAIMNGDPKWVDNHQVECHAYYASCLKGKKPELTSVLDCMAKRHNDRVEKRKHKR